ncbi:MAG TPA: 2-phospho-L-lactate transferase CofD family protein, partial [Desulfurivibrionaceae bacterium]|nr:2-phospho-L-lactate transferase CofD family protein [Desulfurivibrionaceae bacterium]
MTGESTIGAAVQEMAAAHFGPLDLLPYTELPEKLIALALTGPPAGPAGVAAQLRDLATAVNSVETGGVRVVVFGGGTGLSNVIGGDSRNPAWPRAPFLGLKSFFPQTQAIVCVTDDGGSTGELLKELPLIAIGDLRHVLLAAVQKTKLQKQYDLTDLEATRVAASLHALFTHRFNGQVASVEDLLAGCSVRLDELPEFMGRSLHWLLHEVCTNPLLQGQLKHPHCLGNLLVVAAIYQQGGGDAVAAVPARAIIGGLEFLADLIGANGDAVLPCTTTPAHLKIYYDNGVLVAGEHKSSEARRHCAVDRVFVEFAGEPEVPAEVLATIAAADIILFAPGSLFTSIVPILQVPGVAEAIRANRTALKVLISNLWVQAGETDLVMGDPEHRFHVSDLLLAYQRNIPGGIAGLFEQVMVMGLEEIPGS